MRLIIGLGNPGSEHAETRHNAGWLALDRFAALWPEAAGGWTMDKKRKAEVLRLRHERGDVLLAKPQTMMNLSGEAAAALVSFYKLSPADVIVVHDELDLPLGTARLSTDSGAAGHNGVASVIAHLGTKAVTRIRIGIRPERPYGDGAEFVLGRFGAEERAALAPVLGRVAAALAELLAGHPQKARQALAGDAPASHDGP